MPSVPILSDVPTFNCISKNKGTIAPVYMQRRKTESFKDEAEEENV